MSDSSLLHAVAGAGAGCASLAITYPLYARMIRQQVHQQKQKQHTTALDIHSQENGEEAEGTAASSLLSEIRHLLTPAGLAPHFAGLPAALYAITVQSGVFYYFMQVFRNLHGVTTSPLGNLGVSTEAGIATVLLTNPLWVINSRQITRMAPQKQQPAAATDSAWPDQAATGAADAAPRAARSSTRTRIARTASTEALGMLVAPKTDASATDSASPEETTSSNPLLTSPFPAALDSSSEAGAAAAGAAAAAASAAPAVPAPSSPVSLSDVSFFTALRLLVAHEGLAGVYSGVGPALALVSSPALQFACYEWMKALLMRSRAAAARRAVQVAASGLAVAATSTLAGGLPAAAPAAANFAVQLSNLDLFWLGAVSKIVATVLTYPIQTLKARLQRDGSPYAGLGWLHAAVRGIADMAQAPDPLAQFYQGLPAKILQTGLTAAFLFVFRERFLWLLVRLTQMRTGKRLAP